MDKNIFPSETAIVLRFRLGSRILSAATLLMGLMILAGAYLGIRIPGELRESGFAAKILAGFGYTVLGTGLVSAFAALSRPTLEKTIRRLLGGSVTLLSLLLLGSPLFSGHSEREPLNLMLFALLGFSLAGTGACRPWIGRAVQWTSVLVIFACGFFLTAYLYDSPLLYGPGDNRGMHWPSAVAGMTAALATLGLRPQDGAMHFLSGEGTGSVLARWLLPIGPLFIIGLGWARQFGERRGLYPSEFGLALFAMFNVAWFIVLIVVAAAFLNRGDLERRAREEKIRSINLDLGEKTRRLVAAMKELESFSYSVSHDLRAPLRHIAGFGEKLAILAGESLDEKGRHYLDVILQSTRRMGNLIDDLLEFSRAGRTGLQKSRVRMDKMVGEILSDLREADPEHPMELKISLLPEVEGDPILLRQVWSNLLGNAWKYTRHTSLPRIEVASQPVDGREYAFRVRDNGAGFDMRHVKKLFGVFQRLHSEKEYEGTGIGLALVRRIVERHGGRVWAEGNIGEGAEFGFTLPGKINGKDQAWNG